MAFPGEAELDPPGAVCSGSGFCRVSLPVPSSGATGRSLRSSGSSSAVSDESALRSACDGAYTNDQGRIVAGDQYVVPAELISSNTTFEAGKVPLRPGSITWRRVAGCVAQDNADTAAAIGRVERHLAPATSP